MTTPPPLVAEAVHLWRLEHHEGDLTLLSTEEVTRLKRYRRRADQARYCATQSAKRSILARYLAREPRQLAFQLNEYGKPSLDGLEFSISHTTERSILAVSMGLPIGIDIERLRPQEDLLALARRILNKEERRTFEALSPSKQLPAFYRYWTAKEAYLKALATGFQIEPSEVKTDLKRSSVTSLDGAKQELVEIACGEEFVCHLARATRPSKLSFFTFDH